MSPTKLTLDDITDLRAYEREREEYRGRVIALKRLRRVQVGPIVTLLFENRETIRFQIQEMARAERLISDEQIRTELDIYNPLIPDAGRLTATLFIELTSKPALMEWLPRLVGIERAVEVRVGGNGDDGDGGDDVVRSTVDEAHAQQLTREEITASVHYIRFELTPEQVARFATGPVVVAVNHPEYQHATTLSEEARASLAADLQ